VCMSDACVCVCVCMSDVCVCVCVCVCVWPLGDISWACSEQFGPALWVPHPPPGTIGHAHQMAMQSGTLAWEISWTEEAAGGLSFMGVQRVRHDLATKQRQTRIQKREMTPLRFPRVQATSASFL